MNVVSGVPQGSVLGPLLLLLYVNDIPNHITSTCRLYADDCILYRQIDSSADANTLQFLLTERITVQNAFFLLWFILPPKIKREKGSLGTRL